jgi:hypothetical protein
MISFTLIILKDPILLDSIRDFTLQKFSWPAVDKISEYNTDWFSSKVHIDKKIKEIIKVYPVKECYWEELKDTLSTVNSSHALIVKEGNIVELDLFPDFILNTIGPDDVINYSLIGHILDKKERYYNLHNQMFLINVDHWKDVGAPTFDRAKNIELQDVIRSTENFHDDYTPISIVKGESKKTYTNNTAQGSQVISALLENNYKVRPFQIKERSMKVCCYDSINDQVSTVFNWLQSPNRSSHNIVYVNSTSTRPKEFKNNNNVIVSVASPINLLSRIKDKYKDIKKVIFYDISLPALIWTELFFKNIKEYDYDVEKLFQFYSNCGGTKFVLDIHLDLKSYRYSVKEYAELLDHLFNCEIVYRFGDITRPSIYTKKNLGDLSNSVGVNFTNVWEYQRNVLRSEDSDWFQDVHIPLIQKERKFEYLF